MDNRKDISNNVSSSGHLQAIEAASALAETEASAGAAIVSMTPIARVESHEVASARELVGYVSGLSASGSRVAGFVSGSDLSRIHPELSTAARDHLPIVVNHACGAMGSDASASHDPFVAMRDTGCFLIFGADAQEAIDLALISHRIAEVALIPGICSQDEFSGSDEVFTLQMHGANFVEQFLGKPDTTVPAPTPSQQLLFGEERRRIPRLIDINRPAGVGSRLDGRALARAIAGQEVYYSDDVARIAEDVFDRFTSATGRSYAPVSTYRAEDADYLVIAMGSVTSSLKTVVDELRKHRTKAGLVTLRMYRPFPGSALSHLLRGKKGITILEGTSGAFTQDPPVFADLRAVLDRSTENGLEPNAPLPYPDHASVHFRERPVLYSALAYSPANASIDDLRAVFENMLPRGSHRRSYHLGIRFGSPEIRVPGLERLGKLLESAYDGLYLRGLTGFGTASDSAAPGTAIRLLGLGNQNMSSIGALMARTLFRTSGGYVESRRLPMESHYADDSACTVYHHMDTGRAGTAPENADVVAAARSTMLSDSLMLKSLKPGGAIVISTERLPAELWSGLPAHVREAITKKEITVYHIAAEAIARDLSTDSWTQSQLTGLILAAAALSIRDVAGLAESFETALMEHGPSGNHLQSLFSQAFEQGRTRALKIDWDTLPLTDVVPTTEPGAPWTVREAPVHDETAFDAGRFWNSVGYLYETGRPDETLTDPYVVSGLLPARTAAFRSWSSVRTQIPHFLPENCTACGACFAACPETALPVTIGSAAELIESAVESAEKSGASVLQLRRLLKHVTAQAHRMAAGDQRHEYRTLGDLIDGAFEGLLTRMDLSEEETAQLRSELVSVTERVRTFPIARTETFFDKPEKQKKGSGLLFSMNINAEACKACGICATECPDNAIELAMQTTELVGAYRRAWDFAMNLPIVPKERIDAFISPEHAESGIYRLLDRRAYHSMVGGHSATPGSGTGATLHIIAAVADAIIRPRAERFAHTISETIEHVQNAIRDDVRHAVDINDFEDFGRRLGAIETGQVSPSALTDLAHDGEPINRERLQLLNEALISLSDALQKHREANSGSIRATMVAAFSLSQPDSNSARYPYNPFSFPWINVPSGDPSAVAEGIFEGVTAVVVEGIKALRKATLILDDIYVATEHDHFFEHFDRGLLTDEEWELCPPVCVFARTEEDVFPHLLHMKVPVKVFILDDEFPVGADQTSLRLWPVARPDMFVLRSTVGVLSHLLPGLQTGLASRRMALFHLHVCEPANDGVLSDQSFRMMRQAVECRAFPLLTYDPDQPGGWTDRWDMSGNPATEDDWAERILEDAVNGRSTTRTVQLTAADWAVQQGRYHEYFEFVPRGAWTADMVPLIDYLALPDEKRADKNPYVEIMIDGSKQSRFNVLPDMVSTTDVCRRSWNLLQDLAGIRSGLVDSISARIREDFDAKLDLARKELADRCEEEVAARERSFESRMHDQLTEELLSLSAYGPGTEKARERLADLAGQERDGRG